MSNETEPFNDKLTLLIGTYHCTTACFELDINTQKCDRKWVDNSSTKSIKSIAFNGTYSAFGGNDEELHIINVATKKNVGILSSHQGSITHLEFYQNTHLISSSDDGRINIFQIGGSNIHKNRKYNAEWVSKCSLNDHYPHSIIMFSIHPSGKLLLTIDIKNNMKIWDLMRGKCIVTINMPKKAIHVKWSPDGQTFAVVRANKILIYHKEGDLYRVIKPLITPNNDGEFFNRFESIIYNFCYILHDTILIADMSARIIVYDIETKNPLFRLSGHDINIDDNDNQNDEDNKETSNNNVNSDENTSARIKCIQSVSLNDSIYVISGDNRGKICIWNFTECLNLIVQLHGITQESNDTPMSNDDDNYDSEADSDDDIKKSNSDSKIDDDNDVDIDLDPDMNNDDDLNDEIYLDENDLYVFMPTMEIELDAHITCMDIGILGKRNAMYNWRKIWLKELQQTNKQKQLNKNTNTNDIINNDNEYDSDNKNTKIKHKKWKKKNKKKPKIDLSRFD